MRIKRDDPGASTSAAKAIFQYGETRRAWEIMETRAVSGQRPAFLTVLYCVARSRDNAKAPRPLDRVNSRGDSVTPPP
jgi:uncharacterized membrane-anchored protein